MVLDIQIGVTDKQIPLEGKIIRVADEFDAIVSKRQYKSHIGICETLQILEEEASSKPKKVSKDDALSSMHEETKKDNRKIDIKIFKALVKIVIEDTEYEISSISDYIKYIDENIKRLNQIGEYQKKLLSAKNDKDKSYYQSGMKMLFDSGETFENWPQVLEEYKTARDVRSQELDKLYGELKNIKKMK